jgi:hypothetical protein
LQRAAPPQEQKHEPDRYRRTRATKSAKRRRPLHSELTKKNSSLSRAIFVILWLKIYDQSKLAVLAVWDKFVSGCIPS